MTSDLTWMSASPRNMGLSFKYEETLRIWNAVGHSDIPWTWPEAAARTASDLKPDISKYQTIFGFFRTTAQHRHRPLT